LVKFSDHSEVLEFRAFFQFLQIPYFHLDCHLISHSPFSPNPTHSLSSPWPAKCPKGVTPHASTFTQSSLASTQISPPLQNPQHINSFTIANLSFSSSFTSSRELSPKFPHLLQTNPSFKNPPNLFTSNLKDFKDSPRASSQGLLLQPPTLKATPRGTSPSQASTSTQDLKPSSSPLNQTSIEPTQVSTLLTKT